MQHDFPSLAAEIGRAGGEACIVPTDVSKPDDVSNLVSATVHRYGRLDGAFTDGRGPLTHARRGARDR